jgi:hypothetical protein
MRILPTFNDPVADVGVITLLPPEPETPPTDLTRDLTKIAATPDDRVTLQKRGITPQ